jgi:ABC-type multidrug transport system fused ATPase/permease subunit
MNQGSNENRRYGKWLIFHIFDQKLLLLLTLSGISIVTFSRVLIPVIIGEIIDNALFSQKIKNLVLFLLIFFVIYFIRNAMDYLTMMVGHYLGFRVEQSMRQEFFDKLQYKPLRYHDRARTGDLQALATNDLRIINTMISHGAFFIYPFFQVLMAAFLILFTLDLRFAIVTIPFIVTYFYFIFVYRRNIAPYAAARMRTHSNLAVVLQDNLSGVAVVRSFVAEAFEREKFHKAVNEYRDNRMGEAFVQSRFYSLLLLYATIGITFLMSSVFVFQDTFTIGGLTAVNLLLISLIHPSNMIFWATNDMMSGFAACSRLFNALILEEDEDYTNHSEAWPEDFKGKIEFRNVTFGYENESNISVLSNLSFTIEPNQRIALVGPTGCGKTTLVKLLLLLYEPQEGEILLDDKDIRSYPLDTLRKHIGYIEQDPYLFSQTIRENITFGKPDATLDEAIHVAKLAQVDDFVQEFSDGYETIVGERGTRLSGGEKQRIAIARAFLTDPKILILDDSVSAVDCETEEKITDAMENITQNRTTLIITHRLHTIRSSDKIIVLKSGRIAAEGHHNDLLNRSEDYRRIFGKHLVLPEIQVKQH